MDANKIIQQGETVKYKATFGRADFDPETQNFYLELHYGMMGGKVVIPKSQFLQDGESDWWLFSFDTSQMVGKVTARMVMEYADGDTASDTREEVNEQMLCFVVTSPCPRFMACPTCTPIDNDVTYERTEVSNLCYVFDRLTDVYGRPFITSDGYTLYVVHDQNI